MAKEKIIKVVEDRQILKATESESAIMNRIIEKESKLGKFDAKIVKETKEVEEPKKKQ